MTVDEIREPGPEPIATFVVGTPRCAGRRHGRGRPIHDRRTAAGALLGCFAEGETVVEGAAELRAKESDRIAGIVDGLSALGAEIEAQPDGFAVEGPVGCEAACSTRAAITGWRWSERSRGSPRGGRRGGGFESVAVSYPRFDGTSARCSASPS
jgi:3-phosphoshikimate 1-carboxyvinyltransferase